MSIAVKHFPVTAYPSLARHWRDLAVRAKANPFLTPQWCDAWLTSAPDSLIVVEATQGDRVVGLAVFNSTKHSVLANVFSIKQLWLHKIGQASLDQIWIEHNDFLLDSQCCEPVRAAMLNYLKSQMHWHELILGMATDATTQQFAQHLSCFRTQLSSPDYAAELTGLTNLDDYLAGLSKNTRSQIRRTRKILSERGQVQLISACSNAEKNKCFETIQQLHQQKWRGTELGSGFDNPHFVEFHKKLVFEDTDNRYTSLFALSVDQELLGLAYILKQADCWYFYLSGINTHPDNRVKVGLLLHSLIIELAIQQGVRKYSFLAGHARYKQSLSNVDEPSQHLTHFYRHTWLHQTIAGLSWLKRTLFATKHQ